MKNIFKTFAFAAVAAAAITACNKENEISIPVEEQEFVYTFAIGEDAAMTKAILASDTNGKFAQWESGDRLGSITTSSSGYSSITPASGETPATFSIYSKGGLTAGNTITVWYPYGGSAQSDATAVSLVIPDEQSHLSDGSFDFDAMPMVAKQITVTAEMASTTNNTTLATINFANIGSVLNFKVFSTSATYASEKVKSITFNAKNEAGDADANIGGTFTKNLTTIDPNTESTMTIASFTDGVSSIVTKPFADAAIGTTKGTALDLYMVVAPGTYKGTIMVKTDAAEYTYTLSAAKTFARSGIKAFGLDLNSANVSREEKAVVDYVTLDWDYDGGTASDLNAVVGVTTSGLGSDYGDTHAPNQVKLDNSDDYIQVKTDVAIGTVSVGYKMVGGSNTSYLNIFESADGIDWGERIDRLTIAGTTNSTGTLTTTATFNDASRFVKIVFEKGSNVGIGAISIHKPNTDPVIQASDIANVPAAGVTDEDWTYTVKNFTDDVEVAEVTGCVSAAIADAGAIVYSVTPNYSTTANDGTIVLWSAADHSVTKTINVAQLKSTLTVSATTVTIPASSTTATFTVTTAEFGYNAVVASTETGMNLSVSSGASGSASASAQTVTVSSTTAAPTSGDPITLGTINVYRTADANDDTQLKTITIKKAVDSGSGDSYTIITNLSNGVAGTYVIGVLRSTTETDNFYFATKTISSGDINTTATNVSIAASENSRTISADDLPEGTIEFTFTGDNTNGFTVSNGSDYLYYTSNANRKLDFNADGSTYKWIVTEKTGKLSSAGIGVQFSAASATYYIVENSTAVGALRGYTSNQGSARGFYLFKKN